MKILTSYYDKTYHDKTYHDSTYHDKMRIANQLGSLRETITRYDIGYYSWWISVYF